jgi:hypothetical protein
MPVARRMLSGNDYLWRITVHAVHFRRTLSDGSGPAFNTEPGSFFIADDEARLILARAGFPKLILAGKARWKGRAKK